MNSIGHLQERWSEYAANNRALRAITLGQQLAILVLVCLLIFRHEIVTISPPDPRGLIQYGKSQASEDALTSWGLYLATLLGNVSPNNAEFVSNSVGQVLDPSIYQDVMQSVAAQTKRIQDDQLSLSFQPANIKFDAANRIVYVTGWLATRDAHGTAQKTQRTYELWWTVSNYQPRLTGMKAYEGDPQLQPKDR